MIARVWAAIVRWFVWEVDDSADLGQLDRWDRETDRS